MDIINKIKKINKTVFIIIFIMFGTGCIGDVKKIDLTTVDEMNKPQENDTIRIAVAAVLSPKESYVYYKDMMDYISNKTGKKVEMLQKKTYLEINNLIKKKEVDVAFVCGGAYISGHDDFGMELLVAPVSGDVIYYSYIIVPSDSKMNNFSDLRGKRFAFSDPLSNSGKLYPTYRIKTFKESPESYFSSYIYTYSHDNSVFAVSQKLVDGAAVDSLVWEYLDKTRPDITRRTKIIEKSPPFGIPPVVVSPDLNAQLKNDLRNILLNMDKDKEGKQILEKINIDRFIIINDSAYDSMREMR